MRSWENKSVLCTPREFSYLPLSSSSSGCSAAWSCCWPAPSDIVTTSSRGVVSPRGCPQICDLNSKHKYKKEKSWWRCNFRHQPKMLLRTARRRRASCLMCLMLEKSEIKSVCLFQFSSWQKKKHRPRERKRLHGWVRMYVRHGKLLQRRWFRPSSRVISFQFPLTTNHFYWI